VTRRRFFQRRESHPRLRLDLALPSLMWPNSPPENTSPSAAWEADLGLNELSSALTLHPRYASYVRQILIALVTDPAVIHWRQRVLSDFVHNPPLVERAQALLPRLASLGQRSNLLGRRQRNLLLETADQLFQLDAYVQVVQDLNAALGGATLESPPLLQVRDSLATLTADPNFQALRDELPELRAPLEQIASLTIGINLDLELRPISAVLLDIHAHKFGASQSWLEQVIGGGGDAQDETGIAALHTTPEDPNQRILVPLFQDLDRLMTETARPVANALSRYARGGSGALWHLEYELAFFTAAARMIQQLQGQGVSFCQPEMTPMDERTIQIRDLVNPTLMLRQPEKLIANGVEFGAEGRIAVLTGPNSGGKTTFLRSVGLAQVMSQAGLFLPAQSARLSPVDSILTHFPALETRQQGRLAEEAERLRELFGRVTPHSLVLLNETFSSTSAVEAVYLAHDILAALRAVGARAIYATHLIDLTSRLDEIEAAVEGDCRLFSLAAGVRVNDDGDMVPTYTIMRGQGRSYAREVARRHGISLEQILAERHS
jgi:DNA mismatch repair protein MutS